MTNLTIRCPNCKQIHIVECESVWSEQELLEAFRDRFENRDWHVADETIKAFLKEREG